MDYEFLRDITGVVKVRMSMGHEVVGHWFNEEVKENLALLDEVEQAAHALKGSERSWQRAGHEYTLWMDGEEVMVRANQLEFAGDEMEEGMNYYDEESLSLCGVEDFLQVVAAYRNFVQQVNKSGGAGSSARAVKQLAYCARNKSRAFLSTAQR